MAVEKNIGSVEHSDLEGEYGKYRDFLQMRKCQVVLSRIDLSNIRKLKKQDKKKVESSGNQNKMSKRSKQIETENETSGNENSDSEEENDGVKLECVMVRKMSLKRNVNLKETKRDSEASESEEEKIVEKRGRPKKVKGGKNKTSEYPDDDSVASGSKEKRGRPKKVDVKKNKTSENPDDDSEASENEENPDKKKRGRPRKFEAKTSEEPDDDIVASGSKEKRGRPKKEKRGRPKKFEAKTSEDTGNNSEASDNKEEKEKKKRGRPKKAKVDKAKISEDADNDSEASESKEEEQNKKRAKRVEVKKRKISEDDSEASDSEETNERKKAKRKRNEDSEASLSSENEEEIKGRKHKVPETNEWEEESEDDSSGNESISPDKQDTFKPRLLKCKKCKEEFKLYAALERHGKVHESFKFSCVLCGEKFKTRTEFAIHMNREHPEVELFPCLFPKCNASFHVKKKLKDHENVHFKYMCRFCKRRFRKGKMMRWHVREAHL